MRDFGRTLQTADDAERIAKALARVAASPGTATLSDRSLMLKLSQRYEEYSEALRDVVMPEPEPEPAEQAALF